uniref:Uncharacterized protein n=2 Tax=viral metagenome TaxID=1070528 RepID=A0A6C0IBP2_9ZZZZ
MKNMVATLIKLEDWIPKKNIPTIFSKTDSGIEYRNF